MTRGQLPAGRGPEVDQVFFSVKIIWPFTAQFYICPNTRSRIGQLDIMKLVVSRHQSEAAAIDDSPELPPIFFGPSIIGSHRQ